MDIYAIRELCEKYKIKNYTIRPDGLLDVNGSVNLRYEDFISLPIKFGTVSGDFNCRGCQSLTSLQGAPQKVGGYFDCRGCRSLISLQGSPQTVGRYFNCWNCASLTNLQGAPQIVGGNFDCRGCRSLISLQGSPQTVGGDFNCSYCASLINLQGAPKKVGEDFDCRNTSINIKGLVLINAKTYNDGEVKIPKDTYGKLIWIFMQ